MRRINLYLVYAVSSISNLHAYNVGIFTSELDADRVCKTLRKDSPDVGLSYKYTVFELNSSYKHKDIIAKSIVDSVPEYLLEEVIRKAKNSTVETAVRETTMNSINKIITEVLHCMDNPEVLKDYIQGLQDNVEDYI